NARYNLEADGTDPNRAGRARNTSTSEHASPPPARVSIACTNTLPRSWNGNRSPIGMTRADNAAPNPSASAKRPNACKPTCATTPPPPVSIRALIVLVTFIRQVPFPSALLGLSQPQEC